MAELFALLRTEPQHVAQDILRNIRNGLDVRTVLDQVNSADDTEGMVEILDLADPTITAFKVPIKRRDQQSATTTESGSQLPDGYVDMLMPPGLVSQVMNDNDEVWPGVAQRWTRLTSNDALVSHLIHMYYEHQQWVCDFNDRALFIEDFVNGGTYLCSEILVNAILANGCVSQDVTFSIHNTHSACPC